MRNVLYLDNRRCELFPFWMRAAQDTDQPANWFHHLPALIGVTLGFTEIAWLGYQRPMHPAQYI